jgi:hypothetical protein
VRIASTALVTVTGPSGCTVSGPSSFVGEPGGSPPTNFAGGAGGGTGYYGGQAAVAAGLENESCDYNTIIGAGEFNKIGGDASSPASAIAAGNGNGIEDTESFIGAGRGNTLSYEQAAPYYAGSDSGIASGVSNTVVSPESFIGAGYMNSVSGNSAAVVGGRINSASGDESIIGGGSSNSVSGLNATISGGYGNVAKGQNAAIPGGADNAASGRDSFAAGFGSLAANDGTFVWSDFSTTAGGITSSAPNQFLARAAGGFYLYSSASLKSGVKLAPGSGSWASLSDRASKTGIASVDDARILAKVAALPVSEWSYIEQGTGVRHLGPMAQDFRAAFGLGEDEKHISAVDEEGVALAAIKALQNEVSEKDRQLKEIRQSDDTKFANLERRLEALEHVSQAARASGS